MDKGNEKRGLVQLICVLLSFCLWLYVTSIENPNKSSEIKDIPVEIINEDVLKEANLALSPNQNFTISLRVEGPANEVYSVKSSDFKIIADLGTYVLKKGENNVPVKVDNYPQGINIKNTGVLSIKINIEDYVEKYVDVISKVETSFADGFLEKSIDISPKNVKVSGPESEVLKVKSAALIGKVKNISEDFKGDYELWPVNSEGAIVKGVKTDISKGTLNMEVAKGVEVPIKAKYTGALKDGLSIEKVVLSRNSINVIGAPQFIEGIKFIETEPINLSNITASTDMNIKLVIPDGITVSKNDGYVDVSLKIKDDNPISKSFNVKVNYTGVDAKYEYASNSVDIVLEGSKDALISINTNNIKVEANVSGLVEGKHEVEWRATLTGVDRDDVYIKISSGKVPVVITTLQ